MFVFVFFLKTHLTTPRKGVLERLKLHIVIQFFVSYTDLPCIYILLKGGNIGLITALAFVAWIGMGTSINNVVITPKSPLTTAGCNMTAINALGGLATTAAPTTAAVLASTTPATAAPPEYAQRSTCFEYVFLVLKLSVSFHFKLNFEL